MKEKQKRTINRGRTQRVARPACAKATAFLSYIQTGYATAMQRMTLKPTQRT